MSMYSLLSRWTYSLFKNFACEAQVFVTTVQDDKVSTIIGNGNLLLEAFHVFNNFVIVGSEHGANWSTQLHLEFSSGEGSPW